MRSLTTVIHRSLVAFVSLLIVSCGTVLNTSAQPTTIETTAQTFQLQVLVKNLETPWGLDFLPEGQLLITEREGRLLRYDPHNDETMEISGLPPIQVYGQGGLLDVAVHPKYAENSYIYLSYTHRTFNRLYTTRLARAKLHGRRLLELEVLFEAEPAFSTVVHYGSALLFDNDGYLRMTMGDRRNRHLAQDLTNDLGKTYRLTDDGKPAPGNPFAGISNFAPEVYSYGHRNPQGMTIDRSSGRIWVAEHGPKGGDEVNLLQMGKNYGWPVITYGEEYRGGAIGEGTHKEGMEQPLHYYVPSIATAAVEYYDGSALPGWRNSLFVAGLRSQSLSRIQLKAGKKVSEERLLEDQKLRIREVRQGPNGYLYLLVEQGMLLQISP
ncbi:MAG: PQQ-dependent sugar dehydrogenase [Pseudomonadales bacterium]